MIDTQLPPFPGFREEGLSFLRDLAANNDREWFKPRKPVFEDEVQWPLRCLVVEAARRLAGEGLPLQGDPKRSLFRIYRDTRFSSNKNPYKVSAGAVLTRTGTNKSPGGVYIHVQPGGCFLAAGFWHPDNAFLRVWRNAMVAHSESFLAMSSTLEDLDIPLQSAESLKRAPRGFETVVHEELARLLRFKSFTVSRKVDDAAILRPDFADQVVRMGRDAGPLLSFGWAHGG
jgi:uncharacterized protein (TIGR02453 family)